MKPCLNCGTDLDKMDPSRFKPRSRFCSQHCGNEFRNRQMTRGRVLVETGLWWRATRDKNGLTTLTHLLDRWRREDAAAGRPDITERPEGAHKLLEGVL